METRASRRIECVVRYPAMHPLDNCAWHALRGPQKRFAEGDGLALRYDPEVSVFAALPDVPTPDAWEALRALVGPGHLAVLFRDAVVGPPDWQEVFRLPTLQMLSPPAPAGGDRTAGIAPLAVADVEEMCGLAERARPGPFSKRTIELGTYLGIRDGGALVAMAGERMRIEGHTEISAVSTEEAYRGRGLAGALVRFLAAAVSARGEIPFLHVAETNTGAIRLYEQLGFTTRRLVEAVGLVAPK
jgi:ribosomal protein S18 acetylase RimI-like enzyme